MIPSRYTLGRKPAPLPVWLARPATCPVHGAWTKQHPNQKCPACKLERTKRKEQP